LASGPLGTLGVFGSGARGGAVFGWKLGSWLSCVVKLPPVILVVALN
jgi:hypothetical protein